MQPVGVRFKAPPAELVGKVRFIPSLTRLQLKGLMGALALFATAFAAIHALAWNFDFPTHAEQIMWRVCSLARVIIPFPLGCLCVSTYSLEGSDWDIITVFVIVLASLYAVARLFLIVIMFTSFR